MNRLSLGCDSQESLEPSADACLRSASSGIHELADPIRSFLEITVARMQDPLPNHTCKGQPST